MNRKIKLLLTLLLMITALIFNAKGTYANSLITEASGDGTIYINAQINEINEDVFNEKTRGQDLVEYFAHTEDEMVAIDEASLLFSTRTYKVQAGIQNGFVSFRDRSSENGAIQGIMKPTLENGQAVFSNKLHNPYQMFANPNAPTGENEIFKNIYTNYQLPITKSGDTYSFSASGGFYPNLENDTYFTMKTKTNFRMTSDGKTNGEDMYFEIGGNDDIYVFVDDDLVIDLGGIHGNITARINLNKGTCYYQGIYNESTTEFDYQIEKAIKEISEGEHSLSIFYARRGRPANNLSFEYNLTENPVETVIDDEPEDEPEEDLEGESKDNLEEETKENHDEDEKLENNSEDNSKSEREKDDEHIEGRSQSKDDGDAEDSKTNDEERTEETPVTLEESTEVRIDEIKPETLNQEIKTELKSKNPQALTTIASTDVKSLNTQNVAMPSDEQEDTEDRITNIKEPQASKINFEDSSASLIVEQINRLSIIHVILAAIIIILELAILLKK